VAARGAWLSSLALLEDPGHPNAGDVRAKLGRIAMAVQHAPQPTVTG
jgi:hypothetical protein